MKGSVWSVSDGRQQKKCMIPSPRFFSRNGVCAVTPEHTSSLYSVATSGAMYTYMDGREASWKRRSRNKHGVMQTCTRGSKSFSALNLGPPLTLLRLSRALSAAVALELSGESCLSRSLARVILTFRWTKEAGAAVTATPFFAAAPSTHSWRSHIA